MLHSLVDGYSFGGMYCLPGFSLKMKVVHSSKMVVTIHHESVVLIVNSVSLTGPYIYQKWLWHARLFLGM
jgi:hypothetical protein